MARNFLAQSLRGAFLLLRRNNFDVYKIAYV
jgi:hypothetical protein